MSETNAQEPTMEEILASIRRIISEDETPAAAASAEPETPLEEPHGEVAAPAAQAAEPARAPPPPQPAAKADVLELTQRVEPPAPEAPRPPPLPPSGDIDFSDAPPPRAAPPPRPAPARTPAPAARSLVSDQAASAAAGHFGQLAQMATPASGVTLEQMVREMLKPMLKDWLDENLPKIVEASVASEVERISRRGY